MKTKSNETKLKAALVDALDMVWLLQSYAQLKHGSILAKKDAASAKALYDRLAPLVKP